MHRSCITTVTAEENRRMFRMEMGMIINQS